MIYSISEDSADAVWRNATNLLIKGNEVRIQPSRLGVTHELLHVNFEIKNPRDRWIVSRLPAINPAFAVAEVFWILTGSRDAAFINYWNPALPKFAGNYAHYHGAYGHRIKKNFGFDQLKKAYNVLKNNPSSRQVVIQIWDSKRDFPDETGQPASLDVPCNVCSLIKVRDGKLEWLQVMRSNDLYRGTPYNIIQFSTMQEILAGWLNLDVGSYNQISDSLHIYKHDLPEVDVMFSPINVKNSDNLCCSLEEFDIICKKMIKMLKELTRDGLKKSQILSFINDESLSEGYKNLLLVAIADSARRRSWYDEMNLAGHKCSNPALSFAWQAWRTRWIHKES